MATVSDINNTVLSGLNHIDSLLDTGPDWNYLTPASNTILYTFSTASGNESGRSGQQAFSAAQQVNAENAMAYLARITGINFVETSNGASAQLHLANVNIDGANTTGLCSWNNSYRYSSNNELISYDADAYVYLDNYEFASQNANLAPGGYGYETLLHELGHALGLKHPFDDSINLPSAQDNTSNTLMSYTHSGGPHSTYGQYDIAAFNWIYGGDGLRGALGIASATGARYFTGTSGADSLVGTSFNDALEGDGGNDTLNGGAGIDTAVFKGTHAAYAVAQAASGFNVTANNGAADGRDSLLGVERIQFSDAAVAIDLDGHGGQAYRVYQAAFNRVPDKAGVGFWMAQMDQGTSLHDVANGFLSSAEFTSLYGTNPTTSTFVNELYQNVLHRPLDQAGFDFWVTAIDQRGASRADVLAQFSESPENQAQVIGSIQGGFEYTPYHA